MRVCSACRRCYDDSIAYCADEMHPPLSDARPGSPTALTGYRLESLLESGSKAEIYRAVQAESGQSCIVSLFPADNKNTEQFLHEAKLAASLFHPSVVDTYDVGSLDSGEVYVVSEDPEGRTLREFLNDVGTPELLTSIEIIRQAAEALHTLHERRLTHGAIRPENIVLTTDYERGLLVRIQHLDFGGIIGTSIVSNKFIIDSALNSLRYFAPEQCSGSERCAQTDVYSLGIVFYELLAGVPPFDASKAVGLIEKHRSQRVPDLKIDNFELRMLVTHSLMEALQKQPRLRQSSADLFARQLRHIEQLATHSSTPPPAGIVPEPRTVVKPAPIRNGRPSPIEIPDTTPLVIAAETANEVVMPRQSDSYSSPGTDARAERLSSIEAIPESIPVSAPNPIFVAPRSRLKLLKKKLHSMAERLKPATRSQAVSLFEAAERMGQSSPESSPVDAIIAPPVEGIRRKVEWVTPEDDIPSEAAALEVREQEGIGPIFAAKEETIEAPVVPSSVIATEIQMVEKLPDEKPIEAPVVKPAVVAAENPIVEKLPDEKAIVIPVVVTQVVSEETPVAISTPVVEPRIPTRKKKASRKARPAPAPTTRKEKATVRAFESSVRMVPRMPSGDTARPAPQSSPRQRSGLGFKVNLADLEEITLVRPPSKRIKIDWERAVARPDLSNFHAARTRVATREIVFSPTILGATPESTVDLDSADSMFSDHAEGSGVTRRSIVLGAGVVAVLALILFGNDSLTKYLQTWSSADSVTVSMRSKPEEPLVPASLPISQQSQRVLKTTEKRGPEVVSPKPSNEKSRASETSSVATKTPPAPVALAKAPETKKKKDVVTIEKKKSDDKRATVSKDRSSLSIRPRIVNTQN